MNHKSNDVVADTRKHGLGRLFSRYPCFSQHAGNLLVHAAIFSWMICSPACGQGFIGQNINMRHFQPDLSTIHDGPYFVTVAAGTGDRLLLSPFPDLHKAYGVDVENDSVRIDFLETVSFGAGGSFDGLVISSLNRSGFPNITINETAPHSSFDYDGVNLRISWLGLTIPGGATYEIVWNNAPEPTSGVIVVLGGLMFCLRTRPRSLPH